jgi:hypothetical protein
VPYYPLSIVDFIIFARGLVLLDKLPNLEVTDAVKSPVGIVDPTALLSVFKLPSTDEDRLPRPAICELAPASLLPAMLRSNLGNLSLSPDNGFVKEGADANKEFTVSV